MIGLPLHHCGQCNSDLRIICGQNYSMLCSNQIKVFEYMYGNIRTCKLQAKRIKGISAVELQQCAGKITILITLMPFGLSDLQYKYKCLF